MRMGVRLQRTGRDVTGVPGMTIIRATEPWSEGARLSPDVFKAGLCTGMVCCLTQQPTRPSDG
ncbi:hypothetical protein OKW45_001209 [Paraburkholderia sp. WSM4175]